MENQEINIIAILKPLLSNRRKIMLWSAIGLAIGIIIAFSTPRQYISAITLAPEGKSNQSSSAGALANMMGVEGLGDSNAGITEALYPQILKSTPFLLELASVEVPFEGKNIPFDEFILNHQKQAWWNGIFSLWGLFSSSDEAKITIYNSPSLKQRYIRAASSSLGAEQDKKTKLLIITSVSQDPAIAQIMADSAFVKLQRYMVSYKTQKTRSNLESNTKMCDEAKFKYYQSDIDYADALDRNKNLISKYTEVKLDRLKNERDLAYNIYMQLATQVESDRVKLQEETPIATVIEPAQVALVPTWPNRKMIVTTLAILAAFIVSVSIVVKEIYLKKEDVN